jgi:hypothetical protein
MLETGRLKRIFHDFSHFDNALLKGTTGLLTGSVSNEGGLPLAVGDIFRLRGFNLPVGDLLKRSTSPLGRCLDLIFGRPLHRTCLVVDILTVSQRNEVLELRLDELAVPLPLLCDGVVADITLAVYLKSEGIS